MQWLLLPFVGFFALSDVAICRCESTPGTSPQELAAGPCHFDANLRKFAGTAQEEAKCLLQAPAIARASLSPSDVPASLLKLVGTATSVPAGRIAAYLRENDVREADLGGSASTPITAEYFVIHDTSSPNCSIPRACPELGKFPANINDSTWKINATFNGHLPRSGGKIDAHVTTTRAGASLTEADFGVHVSHIKFDYCVESSAKKGLFLGVENIQPRIGRPAIPAGSDPNDFIAPQPGFSHAQYLRLAQIYVVASVRRGKWLIPAYHAVLDWFFLDGHDDPQNFDLNEFAEDVAGVLLALNSES